jgi:hypothetical protein
MQEKRNELTRREVVHQEAVHPLGRDGDAPLLLLQVLRLRHARAGRLRDQLVDELRVQRVQHPVEEVPLRVAVLVLALQVGQVVEDVRDHLRGLRVDELDRQLRPLRDLARRHVLLPQHLLLGAHDVLEVLQARGLERGQQVAD